MPFTAGELTDAGKAVLDFYLKNNPIDQIAIERPLLRELMKSKKEAPGAKQYIVEQLRMRYQSNFQWTHGSADVTYNNRQSLEQANYPWRSAHDGFALNEDRLVQHGITVTDSGPGGSASGAERIQLDNLLTEQTEILRLGFEEKFSQALHLDGTSSTDALTGLDALVSTAPTTGTVGGIDRATTPAWRNHAAAGLTTTTTTGTILTKMELAWRACIRNGGRPNLILAGSTFVDGFRDFMMNTFGRIDFDGVSERVIEGGTKMLTFHGVPLDWSPEFSDLDTLYAPAIPWEKRLYMLNMKHLKLRPMEGQDMITRKPPRAYNRYEHYWAITWRGALTMNRSNAMAVLSLA